MCLQALKPWWRKPSLENVPVAWGRTGSVSLAPSIQEQPGQPGPASGVEVGGGGPVEKAPVLLNEAQKVPLRRSALTRGGEDTVD